MISAVTQDLVPQALPKRTPLAEAAALLTDLCDKIDSGEELDTALVSAFNETKLELAEAVDRRIAFDTWIKGAIETTRQARNEYDKRKQQLEAIHERFKEKTKEIVMANPDLPYEGRLGKLALQRNPPSLQLAFGDKVLTKDLIEFFAVDPEFVKVSYAVDTERVKGALKVGTEITWAALKTDGLHLRFRK